MLFAAPAVALSEDEKAFRSFKFAKGLFDMEKYDQAASELQKFLSFYEKSKYGEYALYLLGESFYKSDGYANALEKYKLFLEKYPASKLVDDVYYSAGYSSLALDKKDGALDYFKKASLSGKTEIKSDAVFKCVRIYAETKDYENAKTSLSDYFKITGGDASRLSADESGRYKEALYIAGNIYLREKKEADALGYYERLLKNYPDDPSAAPVLYNMAEIEYTRGEYKTALESYKKAVALIGAPAEKHPYYAYLPKLYYSAGWCHYSLNDYNGAAENFQACFDGYKNYDNRADCGLRLGICYYNLKKYDRAEKIFTETKKIGDIKRKTAQELDYYLAMTLQKSGLLSNALEHYQKLSGETGEIGMEAQYLSGVILFDQKKYEQSIIKFKEFLGRYPQSQRSPFAAFNVGLAYFNVSNYALAREAFLDFIKKFTSSDFCSRAYFNLGEISMIEKRYDEAQTWFSKIPENDRNWLEAQLKVCDALYLVKQNAKLIEKYEQIIKMAGDPKTDSETLVPALFKIGKTLLALKKYETARLAYEKIVSLSKSARNALDAKYKLAAISFEMKDYEKCLNLCVSLLSEKTSGGLYNIYEAKEMQARALFYLSKHDDSLKISEEILSSSDVPEHVRAQVRFLKSCVLFELKDYEKAVEAFEQLAMDVQDSELLARIHLYLGRSYDFLKKSDDAIKNLLKVEILYKDAAAIHEARLALLEIYVKTKQRKDAKNLKNEIIKSEAPKSIKDRANELAKK